MNFVKASVTYEVLVGDNKYQLILPASAPLGETYDVVYKFLSLIAEQSKIATEALKQSESKEEVKAEVVS